MFSIEINISGSCKLGVSLVYVSGLYQCVGISWRSGSGVANFAKWKEVYRYGLEKLVM